jgi:hypothetical protein
MRCITWASLALVVHVQKSVESIGMTAIEELSGMGFLDGAQAVVAGTKTSGASKDCCNHATGEGPNFVLAT